MSDTDKKLDELSEIVEKTRFEIDRSVRTTAVFYIIIIILVTISTLWNIKQIQELATPKNIAAMIAQNVQDRLPELKKTVVEHAPTKAPYMAEKTVTLLRNTIPKLETMAKVQIDAAVEQLMKQTFNKIMPQLLDCTKTTFDKIAANKDLVKDKTVAEGMAHVMAKKIDDELDNAISASFTSKLKAFKYEIARMAAKPTGKLTRRELAEKKVIIYWLYLVNNEQTGGSPFVESLKFISEIDLK